jgi:hypothetical protein
VAKEEEALGDAPIIMLMMEFTTITIWHPLPKIKVNEILSLVLLI